MWGLSREGLDISPQTNMSSPIEKIERAESLLSGSRPLEALKILKEILAETSDADLVSLAAVQVVAITIDQLPDYPEPGSQGYFELYRFLKVFVESYDRSGLEAQEAIRELADIDAYKALFKLAEQGKSLRAPITPIQEKMADAQYKLSIGKTEDAVRLLKEVVAEANDVYDEMFAAGIIGSILTDNQEMPAPGTTRYVELHKYLRVALDCYDRADPEAQQAFRNVPNVSLGMMRNVVKQMEAGQVIGQREKSSCFIASAAYGTPLAPEVIVLRRFRDQVLLSSKFGIVVTRFYYFLSPPVASLISTHRPLRTLIRRFLIEPILFFITRR